MTTAFMVIAALGFGLLLVGLVFDDIVDGMLDAIDVDGGGILSAPVIGAFLGAFGIGGTVGSTLTGNALVGLIAGGLCGLALGWVALRLSIAFVDMPTDPTVTAQDFHGKLGKVVTPVARGRGEALVRIGGAPVKLSILCDEDVGLGEEIVVVEVISSSTVRVVPAMPLFEDGA